MSGLVAWLLTYLMHSTVLLGGAALARSALRERRLGLQEALLRAALVGGFLTASLQLGLGVEPLGGVFNLSDDRPESSAAQRDLLVSGSVPSVLEAMAASSESPAETPVRGSSLAWSLPGPETWSPALVGLWGTLGLVGLARLGVASVRLRRLLRPRHPVEGEGLASRVAALAAGLGLRRPVPVSTAPRLDVPLATGVLRPEVCLPPRALSELQGEQQEALCAHELAHVARRDPAWVLLARVVEAAAPLQPLNAWARRRLQDLAECLTDDLAVAASGRPEGLARSLVEVAAWRAADAVYLPAAAGALSARGRLGHRVERLMDPLRSLERPSRLLLPLAGAAALATVLVTPAVSGSTVPEAQPSVRDSAPEPPAPPAPPAPPQAPEAPDAPEAPEAPDAPEAPEAPKKPRSEAERELEELTRRIEARAEKHAAEMEGVGAEIERIVEASMPPEEEMNRLTGDLESAAEELAEAHLELHGGDAAVTEEERAAVRARIDAARARMEEARAQIEEATRELRLPDGELQRLQDRAREMAEAVTPTPEERRRLEELTRQIVEESMPDLEELREEVKEISRTLDLDELRREMADVQRAVNHESMEAMRESMKVVREVLHETMPRLHAEARAAREAQTDRGLEEAEESHRDETREAPEP